MKTKIKFGFKFYIAYVYLLILCIILTIIISSFTAKSNQQIYIILCYSLISICFLIELLMTLYNYQYAIINDSQIIFKSLLCRLGRIEISEVKSVKKESLVTFTNSFGYKKKLDWIVFYTDDNIRSNTLAKNGLNRRNKPPFMIPYNDKNASIVKQVFKEKAVINF